MDYNPDLRMAMACPTQSQKVPYQHSPQQQESIVKISYDKSLLKDTNVDDNLCYPLLLKSVPSLSLGSYREGVGILLEPTLNLTSTHFKQTPLFGVIQTLFLDQLPPHT